MTEEWQILHGGSRVARDDMATSVCLRVWANSYEGESPTELVHDFSDGFPTVVPGSTKAANMLKNAMLELSKMGIPVDFDSNAETVPIR